MSYDRSNELCPKCGGETHQDSVDVGVGVIYGPLGCIECGWSEDSEYDLSGGKSPVREDGSVFDQFGGVWPAASHVAKAYRMAEAASDSGFRTKREDSGMRCQIEVVFSPARPDLDGLGLRADPGGFVYRVRDESGRVRVGGSVRTLDPLTALHRAKHAAAGAGFDAWRSWNAGGAYVALA